MSDPDDVAARAIVRAAPGAPATAIDDDERATEIIARNALALGVPELRVVNGAAPDVLDDLGDKPDAIFVGGRLTRLAITHAELQGDVTAWRPGTPVTQWELRRHA